MDFKKKTEENEAVPVKVCKKNGMKSKNKGIKKIVKQLHLVQIY